jgi:hypothetical protein
MKELMDAAHSAKDNNGFSNHARADVSLDAFMSRVNAHVELIEKRGRFQHEEASLAVVNRAWETKERCALWLRTELKSLRQGEARIGAAPIRNRLALSRIKIADLAVTMLECLFVGDNLLRLFQELLNVDRHREELGTRDARLEDAAQIEDQLTLQGLPCGVQKLAKMVSVRPSSVTRWRRSDKYRERAELYRRVWSSTLRGDYFEKIKLEHGVLTDEQSFRHAFRMYSESPAVRRFLKKSRRSRK